MKKILKSFALVAAAVTALVSCQTNELQPEVKPTGKVVYFGTEVNDLTKASLTTEDDAYFTANWENNDALEVAGFDRGTHIAGFPAVWNSEKEAFAASGDVEYFFEEPYDFIGVYPQPVESVINFGSARTQDGNNYAGKYDVMCSEATSLTLVEGDTFVLPMDRQTAIAYFHLTSTLPEDEKIVSATLSVNENLAGSFSYSKGTLTPSKSANSITLSFTNAPSVRDLKLWFNVFPGEYTGLTLEVETENHTLTIKNNKTVTYEQGMLYKVAANATAKYEIKPEEVTIADFIPKENNANVDYKVTAKVTAITNTTFGNLTIEDQTGTLSVYGLTATKTADRRNDQSFASLELKVGDVITICGPHGTYNGKAQIGSTFDDTAVPAYYVSTLEVPSVVAEDIVDVPAAGVDSEIQDATYTAVEGWDYAVTVDGTVVTAAELDSEGILYSVSANNGEARNGWIKFTFTNTSCLYQHVETISVAQLTGVAPADWNATALADIPNGAEVVVTMSTSDKTYALSMNNTNGERASAAAPAAIEVELSGSKLSATPDDVLVWNISIDEGVFMLVCKSDAQYHVYTNNSNNGVRVGKNSDDSGNNKFTVDDESGYIKSTSLTRYLGIYTTTPDWRCYDSPTATNIKNQSLVFYVKDDGKQNQSDFAFSQTEVTATFGGAFTEPTLNGKLTSADVEYSSSNPEFATVDPSTGKVTLVKAGTTVIKAVAPADETYREAVATYTLTVKHVLSSISLNTENVTKEFIPSDTFTSEGLVVTAHYNDHTEAIVTQNAEVIAPSMEEGEHTVTVRYTEDDVTKENSYTINVEHRDIAVTGVSIDVTSKTLIPSGTVQLTATVAPANATNKEVEWSTDDDQVATVSESGLVTAVGAGDAVITVRSVSDNTKYATCAIKVQAIGTLSVDFEKTTDKYTSWTFTNITSKETDSNSNVSAHGGSYFGTTGGTQTGSIQTKGKVSPKSITFYVSKLTTNTTSSTWKVQTSENGTTWNDAASKSATSMDRGTWDEVTHNFASSAEVYVRVYYTGSTAKRTIDDLVLTIYGEGDPAPKDPEKLDAPAGLSCTAQTSSSLTFSWNAVSNASDYKVSLDNQSSWISTNKATTYTWTGLDAEQTKTIYVKAVGDGEDYSDSDAVSAEGTTNAGTGPVPTPTVLYSTGFELDGEHRSEGSNSYGSNTYGKWSTTYGDIISNTTMSGSYMYQGRVARNTTNQPALYSNSSLISGSHTITSVTFEAKVISAFTMTFEYSTNGGSSWTSTSYSPNKSTTKTTHTVTFTNGVSCSDFRIRIKFSVSSSANSNRDSQIDSITINGYAN